ncbi:MG2 domain-containing protein [Myxococcus stipitatus]|uniref:MG2 domain-containing protein n=1 Tax=Myxococcus stipitatus TaxID=83455 RepID=UPI0031452A08
MTERFRRRWKTGGLGALVLLGVWVLVAWDVCLSAWVLSGVKVPQCPDGRFRQTVAVSVTELGRGLPGTVRVWADAHAPNAVGALMSARVRRGSAELFLVDAEGQETPLEVEKKDGWTRSDGDVLVAQVKLPAVSDGDYRLRARLSTPVGTDTVDAALPLYAPAVAHVLTDRPLYEPGNEVRFRAVVLRAKDLAPLDGRPGTWLLMDASGEVVLEERAPAGPWGVVAGGFPLDRGAAVGTWTLSWRSGATQANTTFEVKPFTLPRFQVEALSPKPFWRAGESPEVRGQVVYASGAPVGNAEVELTWRVHGDWPPPPEWTRGGLPTSARADAMGKFTVTLPRVPEDLRGQVSLAARVAARDAAGDRVEGAVSLLLSEDALAVSSVTELEDGLVEGFSNRVYLRATTPDGRVLPGAELTVTRAWDERDEGVRGVTDEDGVAAFQLDPGPPINVVVPPMPVRRPPPPPPVKLSSMRSLLEPGNEPTLQERLAVESWLPALHPCARFVLPSDGHAAVELGVRSGAGGAVVDVMAGEGALPACLAQVVRSRSLPAGRERMLSLSLRVEDPGTPWLELSVESAFGVSLPMVVALMTAANDARACLPMNVASIPRLPLALSWRLSATKEVTTSWSTVPGGKGGLGASVEACIRERFARVRVEEKEPVNQSMGVMWLTVHSGNEALEKEAGQATTFLGYELKVAAKVDGKPVGDTKWVLRPASLPPLRLRATPVLARAGDEVRIDLMRGPGYRGTLPEELKLQAGKEELVVKLEKGATSARFRLPADFEGWAESSWMGATARVYVAPRAKLSVEVSPEKPVYAPGDLARLQVHTQVDGKDGPAAVGLFGVDETLGQLVPLPGGEVLASVRPAPAMSQPAFGVLDGMALAQGRIRGSNAAAATLVRVSSVPMLQDVEARVSASGASLFDAEAEVVEPFYAVLSELHEQVRQWEEKAPEGETLVPSGVAKLWSQALLACEKRGEKVTDAFGNRLRLSRLPRELLELTDPRAVVSRGTRLPEDVENWNEWVAREAP